MSYLGFCPPGVIMPYAGATAPDSWLMCNGAAISRTSYASLYAALGGASAPYGQGDGSTTFNLPDYRGYFLRGMDNMGGTPGAASRDSNRTLGSAQSDSMQAHHHSGTTGGNSSTWQLSGTGVDAYGQAGTTAAPMYHSESHSHSITTSAYAADGANGTPRTSAETRPMNVSVNYIIKI